MIVLILAQAPAGAQSFSFVPSFQLNALPPPCTPTAVSMVTGDFNGDHKPDLAIGCSDVRSTPPTAEISVLLGNGDGAFQAPLVTSLASLPLADK
jgi:FG-GAP repeat